MKIDVLVFAKRAQGCMCEVYYYPLELFLSAQIDQGDRKGAKPSLVFPTAMVVKVKDAETKRNKASVAHTGWNKRTKTSTTTPKKVCLWVKTGIVKPLFTSGTENRGKGISAKGKEEQKPVTTVALDRVCVRV